MASPGSSNSSRSWSRSWSREYSGSYRSGYKRWPSAMASPGSSNSSRSWSGEYSSPIPYRKGPLDYTPGVKCQCGKKAAQWISWSNDNPGRRYLKCFSERYGGCDFWYWYEDNMATPFIAQLLVDLRDAVWRLKKENKQLKRNGLWRKKEHWKRSSGSRSQRRID